MNMTLDFGCKRYRLLLFSLFCYISFSIQAQTRIEIPSDSNWTRILINELEVMGDEQRKWSAESIFADSSDLFTSNSVDAKPKLHNYWARVELANSTEGEQWVSFGSFYWDYVTLYLRDSNGIITVLPFGILTKSYTNKFLFQPQTNYTVLAHFESNGQFRREDNINLVIKSTLTALENKTFKYFMDGIIIGVMLGFALYNMFLFMSLRDRTYLWYSLYIFSFAFSFIALFASEPSKLTQFFLQEYPSFAFYLKKFADPLIWISYTNFVRCFLSTKERQPIWDKVLKICIAIIILQFLMNLIGIYHFSGIIRIFSWNMVVAICITLAIISYKGGYLKARFFILGQVFLLSGILITSMHYSGRIDWLSFLPETDFFNYFKSPTAIFLFGAAEAIVFSFALADKYNILQKEMTSVKIETEKEKLEALRLQELDTFKTRFYANITHEFRTPLTIIDGMANELENNPSKSPKKNLSLIRKNSNTLLGLVNQMLILSKIKAGKVTADLQQGDVVLFIKYMVEMNESFANLKNVGLHFYSEKEEFWTDFDAEKLKLILNNLISNAVKFTPEYGKVLVVVKKITLQDQVQLEIVVKDTGIGISDEQLPHIYNRFYQAESVQTNQGIGIGLALVKEYITVLGGTIKIKSQLGEGTQVILHFPVRNNAILRKETSDYTFKPLPRHEDLTDAKNAATHSEFPLLLIIEDNTDVTYYLQTCLQDQYQIISSRNGKEGIEKAFKILPDIIISDVMMPVMDGFEVCAKLKEDERTSHIPIILLTAKATSEDKLIGLKQGADAYMIKPFEKEELLIRLNKLLEIRKTLQKKYSSSLMSSQSANHDLENKEDSFIKKTENIILSHIEDEGFSIHELARELLLSRSQVHRKIKALTGMSAAIYIRHIRLQKAKELLSLTELSISEIAYQVGFKTPLYFSQVFKDAFGESPSATRK